MVKYCIYRSCKSRSKSKDSSGKNIEFFPVPKPTRNYEKCLEWVNSINRDDIKAVNIKSHHYVCSKHFINENGPTPEYPNPVKEMKQTSIRLDHNYAYYNDDDGESETIALFTSREELIQRVEPEVRFVAELKSLSVTRTEEERIARTEEERIARTEEERIARTEEERIARTEEEKIARTEEEKIARTEEEKIARTEEEKIARTEEEKIARTEEEKIARTEEEKIARTEEVIIDGWEKEIIERTGEELVERAEEEDVEVLGRGVDILKSVAHDFLAHLANNFDKCDWSVDVLRESQNNSCPLNFLRFRKISSNSLLSVEIGPSLECNVKFCDKSIPNDHLLFSSSSVNFTRPVSSLEDLMTILCEIENWRTCDGIQGELFDYFDKKYLKSATVCVESKSLRSKKCQQLFMGVTAKNFHFCHLTKKTLQNRKRRGKQEDKSGVKKNTNLRYMSPHQIKDKVGILNKKKCSLKKKLKLMEAKVKKSFKNDGIFMSSEESKDFENIISKNPFESRTIFQKLLMREQLKILTKEKTRPAKWHPAIIEWCLSIRAKSSSTYEAMRQVIALPSRRTLFNYSVDFNTKSGFNDAALLEMRQKIDLDNLEEHQKYFTLIIDEIQVKQDLVFNGSTGELIGATNLNSFRNLVKDLENKIKGISKTANKLNLASHILQLMVRGITTNFKYPYAYFPSGNNHAEDLYSIVWDAIENLQAAGFLILAIVCDKATSNQKLIKICTESEQRLNNHKVGFRSKNPFNNGEPVYFVSDICHNVKTARTGLSNSGKMIKQKDGTSKPVRLLKKNGKLLLWKHVLYTYEKDSTSILRLAPKLTYNHVHPNAFTCMRVKLAVQVMSSSVANAMEELVGDDAAETVKFLRYFDTFFDILNVSNVSACSFKRKPALAPFRSKDDWRLQWLVRDFLGYLDEWEEEVNGLVVNDDFDKSKMILSRETLEGIRITVFSTIEIIKFLLDKGAPFVLTSRLNQDLLENYFGTQRGACGSGENPTVKQYGEGTKRIKLMKTLINKLENQNDTSPRPEYHVISPNLTLPKLLKLMISVSVIMEEDEGLKHKEFRNKWQVWCNMVQATSGWTRSTFKRQILIKVYTIY